MKVNSIWGTSDRKEFVVNDIKIIDEKTWVYYKNISTGQKYHCLKEAFTNRFTEIVNNNR